MRHTISRHKMKSVLADHGIHGDVGQCRVCGLGTRWEGHAGAPRSAECIVSIVSCHMCDVFTLFPACDAMGAPSLVVRASRLPPSGRRSGSGRGVAARRRARPGCAVPVAAVRRGTMGRPRTRCSMQHTTRHGARRPTRPGGAFSDVPVYIPASGSAACAPFCRWRCHRPVRCFGASPGGQCSMLNVPRRKAPRDTSQAGTPGDDPRARESGEYP